MITFILIIHVLACAFLILIVLMQSGRGGGLTDGFGAAESMFGAKTNVVLVKATTVMAFVFLLTSVSLAYLSAQRDKSILMRIPEQQPVFDPDSLFDDVTKGAERIEIDLTGEATSREQSLDD